MSSSSWLKEEKAAGSHFHWWLYRHGDVVHVCDSRTTCWFPTHVTSHGNLRLAVSVLIQPSAAGEDTVHLPAGWTRRGPGATDQEGGGGASLQDDRVTGETSDCCLLCTIIQNTWIIITPEISNGQTEFYVYLNGVNCPFDESSHLCKVTCQFGRACFSIRHFLSHHPQHQSSPSFLFHTSLPALTPAAHMERPYWEMHMSCCWESTRPASGARDSPRVSLLGLFYHIVAKINWSQEDGFPPWVQTLRQDHLSEHTRGLRSFNEGLYVIESQQE